LGGAYTTVAADVLARWHRMKGEKVFFITGVDEHGQKIAKSAQEKNISPQELCDQHAAKYEQTWDTLKISYNRFIRTTEAEHKKVVEEFLQRLYDKKLIYQGEYQGLYCVNCERYYTSKELINEQCPYHKKKPIVLSEKCYFFKLSEFQKPLIKLISENKLAIEPLERKNEILGFLNSEKLDDLAVSREKVEWGIPLPWDKTQTVYVWIDALLNYLSGLNWNIKNKTWPKQWPVDIHLIGKDILRFHAVLWPALLLSLKAPLPKKVYAHGFFTINGVKMSKSLGNVLDPEEMVTIFGSDGLRWLLLSSFPFGQDGDVSQLKFYEKYNTDLSNGLGNLCRRIQTLSRLNKKEFIPPKPANQEFKKKINSVWDNYEQSLEKFKFENAINEICGLIGFCDKYINQEEPWRLFKTNLVEYQKVMYNLLEGLRHLAWLVQPFMPGKSDRIFEILNILSEEKKNNLSRAKFFGKNKFKEINQSEILFPKL
jgi:methionyl-tRNA synthetase